MKEDLLEKEIKKMAMILQRVAGMMKKGDYQEALQIATPSYNGQLMDDFLKSEKWDISNRFTLEELAFQLDLLYYRLLAQYRSAEPDRELRLKFLAMATKFSGLNPATFDFSLQMKIDEIEKL